MNTPRTIVAAAAILLASGPSRGCPPDFDGDCALSAPDFTAFRDAYLASEARADMNADGLLNVADFIAFRNAYLAGCSADSDDDGVPDAFEPGNGDTSSPCSPGTDPDNPDTDGDGLLDGEEFYGTPGGLDLPALGADPLRKDIFVEADWTDDAHESGGHSHRLTAAMVARIVNAFAAAPVHNPHGRPDGVAMHIDYGQGGAFTGGNLVPGSPYFVFFGAEFNSIKAAHFDARRKGYFHYALHTHRYDNPFNNSSGVAEIFGDDFIVSSFSFYDSTSGVSNTFVHELGHNLGLRHGGFENLNRKPNYNSVMNYNHQFPGIDTTCDGVGDGVLDYSRGQRAPLNENNLNELAGLCGLGAGIPVDWNNNGLIEVFVTRNINCPPNSTQPCGIAGACDDSFCSALFDQNDWVNIDYDTLHSGDLHQEIVECDPPPPQ